MTALFPTPIAALEFTSLPMLGWLAAAVLPWLIHRWRQRQHQTTPWAAVELLLNAMQQRARRIQVQQWFLLAIRTAILVLVALAVAEPSLRQWAAGAGGRTRAHQIVVVDQSYSMGCKDQGTTRWQRAQTQARRWIENNDGDVITLIGWAGQAENLLGRPTSDKSLALAALDDLQLSHSSAVLPKALRAIVAAIDRAEVEMPQITVHQVLFCTDLGRQTWTVDESQQELLEAVSSRANVIIENVAEGRYDNLAITDLRIDPAITILQRQATITATVTSFGASRLENATIEWIVNDRRVTRQQVELHEKGEVTTQFTHRFVGEGPQTVQAVLAGNEDCLSVDDRRLMIVDVLPKLRVACIAGQSGAADDVARALAPGPGLTANDGAIEPEIISVSRLGNFDLSDYAAVVLCNVTELSSREARALADFARQGRGVAVFLGQDANDELRRLLPVQVEGLQSTGAYRFDPLDYRHPIVSLFRGQNKSGLLGISVSQYRRLQFLDEREQTEVVLNFDTGDPALVVGRLGLGRIAVSALPASLATRTSQGVPWSSFAMSPSFLPVVRELISYLVSDRWLQQRNLVVGEAAVLPWDVGAKTANVRLPDGSRQTLPLPVTEDRGQLTFSTTGQLGVYQFSANDQERARFAVNLDGRDSDLSPIDLATLPSELLVRATEGPLALPSASGGVSFVRPLLASAFGLLLLEIGLACSLGRGWG